MATDANSAARFGAINPRDGVTIATYAEASPADVRAAVTCAADAACSAEFAEPDRRARLLETAADALRQSADEVVGWAASETALADARLRGELERTSSQLETFARLVRDGDYVDAYIDHADPNARPIPRPDVRRMLVPVGPIAVFGASNFPLAFGVAGGDTASALAAGCPVIAKGHPSHPGTSELVADRIHAAVARAGLPAGTFALLQGGPSVGEWLVDQPELAAVAFTGSLVGGRAIFDRASRRPTPIPVYAEMGSSNPFLVTAGALRSRAEEIATGLASAISGSAGQLCTKPGIVFVPSGDDGDGFRSDVAARLATSGPLTLLNRQVRDRLGERVAALGRAAAAVGERVPATGAEGGFHHPALVFEVPVRQFVADPSLAEECFGPVALFVRYNDLADLTRATEVLDGQLTATVHLEESDQGEALAAVLTELQRRVGRLVFNGYPTGVSVTPAMQHGGPYPASTTSGHTSVGITAVRRFLRPVAWQDAPVRMLPAELHDENPRAIARHVDGVAQPRP